MINNQLLFKIEDFYGKLHNGDYSDAFLLAAALEELVNSAWDEVDELFQPSIRIDP